jgi:hypothetical protein
MSQHRMRAGVAAVVAVASLAAAAPAGADPNPTQREQAAAQERYYRSHKPADAESGIKFETRYDGRELRTIPVPASGSSPAGAATRVDAPLVAEPPSSSDFEWADAAIGSGATLGLLLLLGGGAAVIVRRGRPATS